MPSHRHFGMTDCPRPARVTLHGALIMRARSIRRQGTTPSLAGSGPSRTSSATKALHSPNDAPICCAAGKMGEGRGVLMPTKSAASGAQRANVTGCRAREPDVEGLALPHSVEGGDLSFNKAVIRWMSIQMRQMARLNVKPSVVVWSRAKNRSSVFLAAIGRR